MYYSKKLISPQNSIIKTQHIPFLVYMFVWALVHTQMNLSFGDDLFFASALQEQGFIQWAINKYLTFNTRVITEGVLVAVMQLGEIPWKAINLCMMTVIPVCISLIVFNQNADQSDNWLIVCLVSIYPFMDMATAGWGATSVNYTWVLATGLFALYCIRSVMNENKLNRRMLMGGYISAVYAANVEQMACVLLAFTVIAIIYQFYTKQKSSKILYIFLTIIIIDLLIILLSPARSARLLKEIAYSYPSYGMLSFVEKITMGLTSTMAQFVGRINWVFLVFSIVLFLCVYKKETTKWIRIIAGIPLVGAVTGLSYEIAPTLFPGLYKMFYYEAHAKMPDFTPITAMNYMELTAYIPTFFCILIMGSILISLFFVFREWEFILPMLVVLAGFCSRMLMAFSPSIYESARRTYLLMYYGFIVATIMIYKNIKDEDVVFSKQLLLLVQKICILPAINVILQVLMI